MNRPDDLVAALKAIVESRGAPGLVKMGREVLEKVKTKMAAGRLSCRSPGLATGGDHVVEVESDQEILSIRRVCDHRTQSAYGGGDGPAGEMKRGPRVAPGSRSLVPRPPAVAKPEKQVLPFDGVVESLGDLFEQVVSLFPRQGFDLPQDDAEEL